MNHNARLAVAGGMTLGTRADCPSVQTKSVFFAALLLAMLFLCTVSAEAGSVYYVRPGATGANSGLDWNNAYTSLPARLERGSTYYIADGSYGSHTFNDAESGDAYIYITKATAASHGPAGGWDDSYGDGTATFSRWIFDSGYYEIDGRVGGGPSGWDSGFGIFVGSTKGERVTFNSGVDHVIIRHAEITNSDNTANDSGFGHLVNAQTDVSYLTFSYCKIHHVFGCVFKSRARNDNWTVEYSKLGDNTGTSANHSEVWATTGSDNLTIRYNWIFRWRSTGGLIAMNGSKGQYGDNEFSDSWKIHGNVFVQDGSTASWVIAAFSNSSYDQFARNWTVVNNTFVDINSAASSVYLCSLDTYGATNNVFVNNVIYGNSDTMQVDGIQDEDYNSYRGSGTYFKGSHDSALSDSPFANYSGKDYRLAEGLYGRPLTGEYSRDANGAIRGNDGVWDRGAFEVGTSGGTRPSPPTNLR